MSDAINRFEKADWKSLMPVLLKYALLCIRRYQWNTPVDSLPEGHGIEDLVCAAIQKTYEQLKTGEKGHGLRVWNSEKIDLLTHLKGVIKSDINTLANLKEHKNREYKEKINDNVDLENVLENHEDEDFSGCSTEANPRYDRLISELKTEMKKDAIVLTYLEAVEAIIRDGGDLSYDSITEECGLSFNDIKNSKRKIERVLVKLKARS